MSDPIADLVKVVREVESHVASSGWDQPTRLFALARGRELAAREPALWQQLHQQGVVEADATGTVEAGLIPIEQEWDDEAAPLDEALAHIAWPPTVAGAALSVERFILSPEAELDVSAGATEAEMLAAATQHPERREVRMTVAVLRTGERMSALRVRAMAGAEQSADSAKRPGDGDDVLVGDNLVPALAAGLLATFADS